MHLNFLPLRGLVVVLLFFGLTLFTLAADKKRKPTEKAKSKAKSTQKADSKQQAKATRNSRQEKRDRNKQQLTRKQSADEKGSKRRDKQADKLAKQREEKAKDKARGKDKTAKREAEKKNDKAKGKLAKREDDKKLGKKKEEMAVKNSPAEKDTKSAKASKKPEIAETKANAKAKPEEKGKDIAKAENKSKSDTKSELRHETKAGDKAKELPSDKFALRPIAKVSPKVELQFSVARAAAGTSLDVPSPRDNGPDVIDVIEHDSPEARRLDDLLRSEMKTLQYSGIPNVSRRKLDVGKMDADRIKQIQEALMKKGYYAGEITGQYDATTIEAMRKFQEANKIDVTGYATAQSLRLLGLTDW
jgi:hypothetical protein